MVYGTDNSEKVSTLVEAMLPWMEKFYGSTFVLKYSGGELVGNKNLEQAAKNISWLHKVGINVIIIHGLGQQLDKELEKRSIESQKIDGTRVYTKEIRDIALVVSRELTTNLIDILGRHKVKTEFIPDIYINVEKLPEYGLVGNPVKSIFSSSFFVERIIGSGDNIVPIIGPFGVGIEEEIYGVNADKIAVLVAKEAKVRKVIFYTPTGGILNPAGHIISSLTISDARAMVDDGLITNGAIPKIESCIQCLENGIKDTHIIGKDPYSLLHEVFTDKGIGTKIIESEQGVS